MRRALLALAILLLLPAAAGAAEPKPDAAYAIHDHRTPGDTWHVELKTNRTGTALKTVLVHSDRCGGHTPYALAVPLTNGIAFHDGPLDPARPELGTWHFEGVFTASHRFDGAFTITTPTCDTGRMLFTAHSGGHTHTVTYGPAHGTMPDISTATPERFRQAWKLYKGTLRQARKRFPSYAKALRRGYVSDPEIDHPEKRPHVFHLRKRKYTVDKEYFRPKRPEALVYYNPPEPESEPILLSFMYRYKLGPWPKFGKPLLPWHSHGRGVFWGVPNMMTHVWLTGDLRSALANCLPVPELEAAIAGFTYVRPASISHESAPCPTS